MPQIDKLYTAIWHNTTTGPGTPLTGLSATISIRDKSTNTMVISNQAMTEIGLGEYDYTFSAMDATKPYSYVMSPNITTAYVVTGFVDPRLATLDKNITDISVGTGGGMANISQAIQGSISNIGKKIDKKIEDEHQITRDLIVKENIDTNSHIDVANSKIISTIDSIEQAEFIQEEKEAKKALKIVTSIDKKLSSYIDSESKEKDELGALARDFTRMEIEDRNAEKEKEKQEKIQEEKDKKKEEEQDKKEMEMIQSEFDKQDEQEKIDKKKEIERILIEKEKEVAELEKELKKL